jgi:hypothetical protein
MAKTIDVWGTQVRVTFNVYDSKTKKQKEIDHPISPSLEREISNQLDSTDMGTITLSVVGTKTTLALFMMK